jgi:ABC-type phosphate transport system substrate-binding protein
LNLVALLFLCADNVDFSAISAPLTTAQQEAMPDVVELPIMAYPAVIAYNVRPRNPEPSHLSQTDTAMDAHRRVSVCVRVCSPHLGPSPHQVPELVGKGTLVLDLSIVADVMLGTVDNWNHSAIRTLNPTLAHLLPNQPIMVVTPLGSSIAMQLMTESLSGSNAQFNQLVRAVPVSRHITP